MQTSFTKTTFVQGTSPAINATELNKLGAGIETMKSAFGAIHVDSATYNATGSTSSNYIATSYRTSAPSAGELPLLFVLQPAITNAAGATITPSWSATAYQIHDMSTNAQILGSVVKANQPTVFVFDGTKFWVNGGGNYLQLNATANTAGYFDKGTTTPTGTTRLNYSGYMYATQFVGAVFNASASDFAEGFDVCGVAQPGELIKINPNGTYEVNDTPLNKKTVGIVSSGEQYGMLFGTNYGETPIAICGRVKAKVSGYIEAGDNLVAAYEKGMLMSAPSNCDNRSVCAMALESNESEFGEILVLVKRG